MKLTAKDFDDVDVTTAVEIYLNTLATVPFPTRFTNEDVVSFTIHLLGLPEPASQVAFCAMYGAMWHFAMALDTGKTAAEAREYAMRMWRPWAQREWAA